MRPETDPYHQCGRRFVRPALPVQLQPELDLASGARREDLAEADRP
jgi:hypothetical protein